jgi:sugar phosphate isomerase/epimerase
MQTRRSLAWHALSAADALVVPQAPKPIPKLATSKVVRRVARRILITGDARRSGASHADAKVQLHRSRRGPLLRCLWHVDAHDRHDRIGRVVVEVVDRRGTAMETALAPLTLHRPQPLDVIAAAGAVGFDLTGIQFRTYGQQVSPLLGDPDFVVATKQALAASGVAVLEVSNVILEENFLGEEATAFAAFAAAVGARVIQVVGWDDVFDRAVESLAFVADRAADVGVEVVVEFMPYSQTKTLGDALSLVRATERSNVKLLLDSLHLFRSGGTVAEAAAVDPGYFGVIQLSDAPARSPEFENLRPESVGNRLVPGTGELPLRELLAVLPDGLPVSLEVPCAAVAELSHVDQARFVLDGFRRFLADGSA